MSSSCQHNLFDLLTYRKCIYCGFTIEYEKKEGKLALLGTEIGNAFDVTPRVLDALQTTDYILCEHADSFKLLQDTLRLQLKDNTLIFDYDLLSDQTEEGIHNLNWLYDEMLSGKNVVMIADQGMPLIMDPCDYIVRGAIKKGIKVTCFPGPDAPVTAINLSGFTVWDFSFLGNLPKESEAKKQIFVNIKNEDRANVFFDKDIYILETLTQLSQILGEHRKIALCFNMTRTQENILRGSVSQIISWLLNNGYDQPRQDAEWLVQLTVVVEGANPRGPYI